MQYIISRNITASSQLVLTSGRMSVKVLLALAVVALVTAGVRGYTETHCQDSKQAIVHLFEWSWDAIADECTKVLGPKGFCGVQVSPPMEHIQVLI